MKKYLLVLTLALAFATTGFTQAKTNSRLEAYYHFSKARLLDDEGQPGQAIDEFKKALDARDDVEAAKRRLENAIRLARTMKKR